MSVKMNDEQIIEAAEKWLESLSKTEGDAWAMNPEGAKEAFKN